VTWSQNARNSGDEDKPEKVLSAVEFSVAREAAFAETRLAVGALDAADVPGAIQHVQQEPVDDWAVTSGAYHNHFRVRRPSLRVSPSPIPDACVWTLEPTQRGR